MIDFGKYTLMNRFIHLIQKITGVILHLSERNITPTDALKSYKEILKNELQYCEDVESWREITHIGYVSKSKDMG
jgi:hypothetical protein